MNRLELALAVRHADVAKFATFVHSEPYFYGVGVEPDGFWQDVRILERSSEPLELERRAFVVVEGDLSGPCHLSRGGVLIVLGDFRGVIRASEQSELILAGDLHEGAAIMGEGISHVFVGGDACGDLDLRGSGDVWVEGSLLGRVRTGTPMTQLSVRGDCQASIEPGGAPALLNLRVDGFMSSDRLEAIAALGYTLFHGSIGASDRPVGLYPELARHAHTRRESRQNRWVIRGSRGERGVSAPLRADGPA